MENDLDFLRDALVELFGVADDKIDNHPIIQRYKDAIQKKEIIDKEEYIKEVLVIHTISNLLGISEEKITPASRFREDLETDSLDLVELIMAFEDITAKEISDEQAVAITTVGDAIAWVKNIDSKLEKGKL